MYMYYTLKYSEVESLLRWTLSDLMKSFGLAVYLLNQTAQHNVYYADDCVQNIVCSKWELVLPVFVLIRFYCIMVVLVCPFFPSFRANSHGRISTVPLINVSCFLFYLFIFYYKLCVVQYRKSVDFPTADNRSLKRQYWSAFTNNLWNNSHRCDGSVCTRTLCCAGY